MTAIFVAASAFSKNKDPKLITQTEEANRKELDELRKKNRDLEAQIEQARKGKLENYLNRYMSRVFWYKFSTLNKN